MYQCLQIVVLEGVVVVFDQYVVFGGGCDCVENGFVCGGGGYVWFLEIGLQVLVVLILLFVLCCVEDWDVVCMVLYQQVFDIGYCWC